MNVKSIIDKFEDNVFNADIGTWRHFYVSFSAYTQDELTIKLQRYLNDIVKFHAPIQKLFWRVKPTITKERLYDTVEEETDFYAYTISCRFSISVDQKKHKKQIGDGTKLKVDEQALYGELPMPTNRKGKVV